MHGRACSTHPGSTGPRLFKRYTKKSKIRLSTYAIFKFSSSQENVMYVILNKLIGAVHEIRVQFLENFDPPQKGTLFSKKEVIQI